MSVHQAYPAILLTLRVELGVTPELLTLVHALLARLSPTPPSPSPAAACVARPKAPDMVEPRTDPPEALVTAPPMPDQAPEAEPVLPALPPSPPAVGNSRADPWATPARDVVIRREWPLGTAVLAIKHMLDRLEGPSTKVNLIAMRAARLGVKRPPGHRGAWVKAEPAAPIAPLSPPAALTSHDPESTSQAAELTSLPAEPAPPRPETAPEPAAPPPLPAPPAPPRAPERPAFPSLQANNLAPLPIGRLAPIRADSATIAAWAAPRGLASHRDGFDLEAVNRKRLELGQAPFELPPRRSNGAHHA